MHLIIMGISNTPLITQTNIIQSIVFIDYSHGHIAFLLSFFWAM